MTNTNPGPFQLSFLAVGPGRSGTTWLHEALSHHPGLCLPTNVKETMFFDRHHGKGLPWYADHFKHRQADQLCGEVGPTYFHVPAAPERIKDANPQCRIVITLRDPVSRTLSGYRHHLSKGRVSGSLTQAAKKMPSIVDSGKFGVHIPRWLETFGTDNVTFALLDDIQAHPAHVLKSIYEFLKVDDVAPPPGTYDRVGVASMSRHLNLARAATGLADWLRARRLYGVVEFGKALGLKRVYRGREGEMPDLTTAERAELLTEFELDMRYVEGLLDRDLSAWRDQA